MIYRSNPPPPEGVKRPKPSPPPPEPKRCNHFAVQELASAILTMERQPPLKLPAPYASIKIDVDKGLTVVAVPSHKTVEVYTRHQIETLLKTRGLTLC